MNSTHCQCRLPFVHKGTHVCWSLKMYCRWKSTWIVILKFGNTYYHFSWRFWTIYLKGTCSHQIATPQFKTRTKTALCINRSFFLLRKYKTFCQSPPEWGFQGQKPQRQWMLPQTCQRGKICSAARSPIIIIARTFCFINGHFVSLLQTCWGSWEIPCL